MTLEREKKKKPIKVLAAVILVCKRTWRETTNYAKFSAGAASQMGMELAAPHPHDGTSCSLHRITSSRGLHHTKGIANGFTWCLQREVWTGTHGGNGGSPFALSGIPCTKLEPWSSAPKTPAQMSAHQTRRKCCLPLTSPLAGRAKWAPLRLDVYTKSVCIRRAPERRAHAGEMKSLSQPSALRHESGHFAVTWQPTYARTKGRLHATAHGVAS